MARFERETILERVHAGIANAKSQGKHCGRPGAAYFAGTKPFGCGSKAKAGVA